jgi:hypothetical protein
MKKITLMVVFSVCLLNAMAQKKIQRQSLYVSTANIGTYFDNNKPSVNLPKIIYYASIKDKIYYADLLWLPYRNFYTKDILREGDVYGRRYLIIGLGKSFNEQLSKHTNIKINVGLKFRGGLQESFGVTNRWICVLPNIDYLYSIGASIGAQATYYLPNKHWGIGLETQYTRFMTPHTPHHFFANVGIGYRFGGAAAKKD